jgi:hypothetical protein
MKNTFRVVIPTKVDEFIVLFDKEFMIQNLFYSTQN